MAMVHLRSQPDTEDRNFFFFEDNYLDASDIFAGTASGASMDTTAGNTCSVTTRFGTARRLGIAQQVAEVPVVVAERRKFTTTSGILHGY